MHPPAFRLLAATFVAGAAAFYHAQAATLVTNYQFTGASLSSSDADLGTTASDIVIGAGLSGQTQTFTIFGNPGYGMYSTKIPVDETTAITANDYFSFTLTPNSGPQQYTTLFFNIDYSANGLPGGSQTYITNVAIRWSVDNFASTLYTWTGSVQNGLQTQSGTQTDLSANGFVSGPVEFRFYFFDNQNEGNFTYTAPDNIQLSAVPEPGISAALIGGFLTMGLRRWRRNTADSPAPRIV
jgi:hypothetical protein